MIVDSDFGKDMKKLVTEYSLITMDLAFEQRVDETCLNQTGLYNSTKPADSWTWLTENSRSRGKNISKQSTGGNGSVIWFRKSLEGEIEVTVSCDFRPTNDSAVSDAPDSLNDLIAMLLIEGAANSSGGLTNSGTILCYKESAKNGSYVCLNATAIKASNIFLGWPHRALGIVAILIAVILIMYSPVALCLFSPTEVNAENGSRVIVLNGTSPVGIRSWISNFFSTRNTIEWKFGLIVILMFTSLIALVIEKGISHLLPLPPSSHYLQKIDSTVEFSDFIFIFYGVSLIFSLRYVLSIWFDDLSMGGQCLTCKLFADKAIIHHGFNEELKQHLHIQPLIVMRCFTYCFNLARENFSFELTCLRIILLVFLVPFVVAVLLIALSIILVMILVSFFYSCPLSTFNAMVLLPYGHTGKTVMRHGTTTEKASCIFHIFVLFSSSASIFGFLVFKTTVFSLEVIRGTLMRLPGYLPTATLVVVVFFYCWKCCRSFTRQYHNLVLKLYKHAGDKTNIQSGKDQLGNSEVDEVPMIPNNIQGGEGQQVNPEVDKVPVIPKDLFEKACEDLMPLRESISLLVVKLVSLLTFFFVVFAVIMETPHASDRAKATATFFTALVPKIIEMLLNKDPGMEKLGDEVFDEKVKHIVEQYRSTTESNNNGDDTNVENSNDNINSSAENETTALLNNVQIDVQDYGTSERSRNTDEVS